MIRLALASAVSAAVTFALLSLLGFERQKHGASKNTKQDVDSAHEKCRMRIHAERVGRIAAERQIREDVVKIISDAKVGFPSLVIGKVESPFVSKRGTPRQGLLVSGSRGILQFAKELPVEAFQGLEGYSHVFVLFIFHDNTNLPKLLLRSAESARNDRVEESDSNLTSTSELETRASTLSTSKFNNKVPLFAAKVFPPLLRGDNTGVFATRSPHHPNPFGQSLVKIESVDPQNRRVYISGLDMCDGSPILDIKPWNPADCPVCLHAIVEHGKEVGEPWTRAGNTLSTEKPTGPNLCSHAPKSLPKNRKNRDWFSSYTPDPCASGRFATRVPQWVEQGIADPYELAVKYTPEALESLQTLVDSNACKFYKVGESDAVQDVLKAILSLDIRSFHQGRGKKKRSPKTVEDIARDTKDRDEKGQEYELDYDVLNVAFTVCEDDGDQGDEVHVLVKRIVLADPTMSMGVVGKSAQ